MPAFGLHAPNAPGKALTWLHVLHVCAGLLLLKPEGNGTQRYKSVCALQHAWNRQSMPSCLLICGSASFEFYNLCGLCA